MNAPHFIFPMKTALFEKGQPTCHFCIVKSALFESVYKITHNFLRKSLFGMISSPLNQFFNTFLGFTNHCHVGPKVILTFCTAPILKHKKKNHQELYQKERIQQVPVDLSILGHPVPIYSSSYPYQPSSPLLLAAKCPIAPTSYLLGYHSTKLRENVQYIGAKLCSLIGYHSKCLKINILITRAGQI